jgi:hypothetical protein
MAQTAGFRLAPREVHQDNWWLSTVLVEMVRYAPMWTAKRLPVSASQAEKFTAAARRFGQLSESHLRQIVSGSHFACSVFVHRRIQPRLVPAQRLHGGLMARLKQ